MESIRQSSPCFPKIGRRLPAPIQKREAVLSLYASGPTTGIVCHIFLVCHENNYSQFPKCFHDKPANHGERQTTEFHFAMQSNFWRDDTKKRNEQLPSSQTHMHKSPNNSALSHMNHQAKYIQSLTLAFSTES